MGPDGVLTYIFNSLAWSSVGAGLALAMVRRRNGVVTHKIQPITWLALGILVFTAITAVVSVQSDLRQRRFAECQARVNDQYRLTTVRRTEINDQDRAAIDKLIFTVAQATDRNVVRGALAAYISTRQANDTERKKNPLPSLESSCGRK